MASKIMKNTFFRAAVLTTIVFVIGVFVGIWLDIMRLGNVRTALEEINERWNDARMQNLYYQTFEDSPRFCEASIQANLEFNEKIYKEGLKIERYEKVNKFTPSLLTEKKRYALLQLQFWMNSVKLKETCNTTYTTLVYFFSKNESLAIDQKLQSNVLLNIKEKCGPELMLTPLPADLDIQTIELIKSSYGIDTYPAILIDERVVLKGVKSEDDLRLFIPCLQ